MGTVTVTVTVMVYICFLLHSNHDRNIRNLKHIVLCHVCFLFGYIASGWKYHCGLYVNRWSKLFYKRYYELERESDTLCHFRNYKEMLISQGAFVLGQICRPLQGRKIECER